MKPLSILFFGNTNNYPFLLAEAMRDLGHDVRLIVNRKDLLHRPESKYLDWKNNYPEWILDFSHIPEGLIVSGSAVLNPLIKELRRDYDFAILNDLGPSLSRYLQAPHASFLTGSDLLFYADYNFLEKRSRTWQFDFKRSPKGRQDLRKMAELISMQREGILTSEIVSYAHRGMIPEGDRLLDSIGIPDDCRTMLYMADLKNLKAQPFSRGRDPLRILCGSRLVFCREANPDLTPVDFKGTDILLQGYAEYCQRGGSGELRLPIKGQDSQFARNLVRDLGIDNRVVWLEEMSLQSFHEEMKEADLICDQFGTSFPGMVTADAYALGRPVMANLRNEVFSQVFKNPLPGLHAATSAEIAKHLLDIEKNRSRLEELGQESRRYAEDFLSPNEMARNLLARFNGRFIEETALFARSPKMFSPKPDAEIQDIGNDLSRVKILSGEDQVLLMNNPKLLALFISALKFLDAFPGVKIMRFSFHFIRKNGIKDFLRKVKKELYRTYQHGKIRMFSGISLRVCLDTHWPKESSFICPNPPSESMSQGKPSVCLVTSNMSSGGAERQVAVLACELKKRGYDVRIRVMSLEGENGHYLPYLKEHGIDVAVADLPGFSGVRFMKQRGIDLKLLKHLPPELRLEALSLAYDLLQNPVDIVHCYLDWACCYAGFAALLSGIRQVRFSWRNVNPTHFEFYRDWMPKLYQFMLTFPRFSIENNSTAGAQDYARWLNLDSSAMEVIFNGIDPSLFQSRQNKKESDFRESMGQEDGFIVASIGRLSPEKRVFDMPEILAILRQDIPEASFVHIGTGPLKESFEEILKAKGLLGKIGGKKDQGKFFLLDLCEDVSEILISADVFLLTSVYEGMPNAVMEAMFLGIPVVSTQAGGIPELIENGVQGFLHDIGDVLGMAESLKKLMLDKPLRKKMGEAGRARILEKFTVKHLADRVEQSYAAHTIVHEDEMIKELSHP